MEPHLLDLRQMHCPMALLLVKRHTQALQVGEQMQIYLCDIASIADIQRYLQKHAFVFSCQEVYQEPCEETKEEKPCWVCLEITKLPVEIGAK